MTPRTKKMKYTIDAKNKKLGRLATEIAVILMGKNTPEFRRERIADAEVTVTNASKMDIDEKKLTTKKYVRYTGYPGGIRTEGMDNVVNRKGYKDVLKTAVYGMLPKNKLRAKMIKNLEVSE
ncbi:MAG: 50S ribosomal protein L13 [Patescibacteria group bacterium]